MKANVGLFILISLLVVFFDQITKMLIIDQLMLGQTESIIPGFFNLTYVRNTGVAFGIFAGHEAWRNIFLLGTSLIIACALLFFFWQNRSSRLITVGTSLIFGGALGNIIDRFRLGYVIDFLDFFIGKYHWPAFNIADSAITIGTFILGFFLIVYDKKTQKNNT